jgi:hypothetical protein
VRDGSWEGEDPREALETKAEHLEIRGPGKDGGLGRVPRGI